ncbi:MAG: VOC family protein [Helicobacter sp.]|nr:VOC family protein [Helicobacter sp.]
MKSVLLNTKDQITHISKDSDLTFHHIGVATKSIESEMPFFTMLGFTYEAEFSDEIQGVRGVFLTPKSYTNSTYPICRFELLENLPNSSRLDSYLKNHHKLYHIAFASKNIQKNLDTILNFPCNVNSE